MAKLFILITLLFVFSISIVGQQQKPTSGASVTVSTEAQKQFTEAVAQAERAKADAEVATARLEVAQTRVTALIFRLMAQLKLSPDEWQAVLTKEGELQFVKIQSSGAAAATPVPTPKP